MNKRNKMVYFRWELIEGCMIKLNRRVSDIEKIHWDLLFSVPPGTIMRQNGFLAK